MWRVLLNCPCTCLHSFFFTLIFPCTSNYDSICIFSYAFDVSTGIVKISCIFIYLSGLTRRRWPARTASWPPPRSSTSTACPRRAASRTSWTFSGSTALLRPPKSVKNFRVSNIFHREYLLQVKFVESKKEREEAPGAAERSGVGLAYFDSVEVGLHVGS